MVKVNRSAFLVVPGTGLMAIRSSSANVATIELLPLFGCPTTVNVGIEPPYDCGAAAVYRKLSGLDINPAIAELRDGARPVLQICLGWRRAVEAHGMDSD